jgi:hypothetical protein
MRLELCEDGAPLRAPHNQASRSKKQIVCAAKGTQTDGMHTTQAHAETLGNDCADGTAQTVVEYDDLELEVMRSRRRERFHASVQTDMDMGHASKLEGVGVKYAVSGVATQTADDRCVCMYVCVCICI